MILFQLQALLEGCRIPSVSNFLHKMLKKKKYKLLFFDCVVFLLESDRKRKNYECDGLGNQIAYKMIFVSAT